MTTAAGGHPAADRASSRTSILVEIGAVVLFAAVAGLVGSLLPAGLPVPLLLAVSLLIALVPAAIWLVAFYRLDAAEPEPKHYVFLVFLLAAVLAAAIGEPLIRNIFRVQDWVYSGWLVTLLGSILVIGFIEQFIIWAVVRYTIFNSAEFDSRIDGVVYGAAAGLGYATTVSVLFVLGNGGVDLGAGAIAVSINALAQASLGAVTGYFLGRAKFDAMGPFWLPLGLVIAASLNGLVTFALVLVPTLGGLSYNYWYGLVAATVIAVVIFLVVFQLIRTLNQRDAAQPAAATRPSEAVS